MAPAIILYSELRELVSEELEATCPLEGQSDGTVPNLEGGYG